MRPARKQNVARRAFLGWRKSWMSREILAFVFFGAAATACLVASLLTHPKTPLSSTLSPTLSKTSVDFGKVEDQVEEKVENEMSRPVEALERGVHAASTYPNHGRAIISESLDNRVLKRRERRAPMPADPAPGAFSGLAGPLAILTALL